MTVTRARRTGWLAAWGRFAARRRWIVLLLTVNAIVLLGIARDDLAAPFADEFRLPGVESQQARDVLEEHFPSRAGDSATVVFAANSRLDDGAERTRVEAALGRFAELPGVLDVASPFDTPGAIASDGRVAFATLSYAERANEVDDADIEALFDLADGLSSPELTVEVGGPIVRAGERSERGLAEQVGLVTAAIVLLVAFGSVIAMGLPIVTALVALGSSLMLLTIATRVFDMSSFTPAFAAMIGLGVGIDYALFVVTRFREELAGGADKEEAVATAVDTAGRAVIFAGMAVVIALLSLFTVGIPFVAALGVAGGIVVGMSVLVAIVLLPALLGIVGGGVNRWRLGVFRSTGRGDSEGVWYRFALVVQRRPAVFAILAIVLLLLLASPVLTLQLGSADDGNNPESFHSRRAYDLLAEGFGPGFNGPLLVTAALDAPADAAVLERLGAEAAGLEGVAAVTPPVVSPDGRAALMRIFPTTAPQDVETGALIRKLRGEVATRVAGASDVGIYIGGQTAVFEDIRDQITSRLPQFFGLVIGLSFLLLMVVFRSLVVPIKAAVMNLLAIGAAYGVLVAIFQWGWLAGPLGVGRPGPIESFAPMMLFAILFGLSMDYEVFLLSRVRENYVGGLANSEAVARGVGQTARVITAAAAIMVSVFLAFALSEGRTIKEFGLGLATAIFVDATVVRLVLVPATMGLLGDANWWFPRWLDRLLPRLQIEGAPTAVSTPVEAPAGAPVEARVGAVPVGDAQPSVVSRVLDAPAPEVTSDLRPVAAGVSESTGSEPSPEAASEPRLPDPPMSDLPEPVSTTPAGRRRPPRDYMGDNGDATAGRDDGG